MARCLGEKLKSLLRSRALRAILGLVVVVVAVWLPSARTTDRHPPPLVGLPFERVGEQPDFSTSDSEPARIVGTKIVRFIDNGKWIVVAMHKNWRERSSDWRFFLFDTEKRRFVFKVPPHQSENDTLEIVRPQICGSLRLDRAIVRQVRLDFSVLPSLIHGGRPCADTYFYELDLASNKSRFLVHRRESAPPNVNTPGLSNRSLTHLAYPDAPADRERYIIFNVREGSSRVLTRKDFGLNGKQWTEMWGWLSDDRTMLFLGFRYLPQASRTEMANLYLVDVLANTSPRNVAVWDRFEELIARKQLRPGEERLLECGILPDVDGGRRLRLFAASGSNQTGPNTAETKWSVWDLDLQSQSLTRVMDLSLGPILQRGFTSSPSGDTIVAFLSHQGAGDREGFDAVLYRVGKEPMRLPFRLRRLGGLSNDDTLIYTNGRDEIWQFDLRMGESELLWSPNKRQKAPRTPDTRDRSKPRGARGHGENQR